MLLGSRKSETLFSQTEAMNDLWLLIINETIAVIIIVSVTKIQYIAFLNFLNWYMFVIRTFYIETCFVIFSSQNKGFNYKIPVIKKKTNWGMHLTPFTNVNYVS